MSGKQISKFVDISISLFVSSLPYLFSDVLGKSDVVDRRIFFLLVGWILVFLLIFTLFDEAKTSLINKISEIQSIKRKIVWIGIGIILVGVFLLFLTNAIKGKI